MKKAFLLGAFLATLLVSSAQLNMEFGAKKTDLKNNALTFAVSYLASLDSIFGNQEYFLPGKRSFFLVTPELDINTGTEDATSSIVLKASGLLNVFKTKTVSGLIAPDYARTFHTFPMSIGLESNNRFNNVNGIVEVGWIPYYQSYARKSPTWIKRSRFGVFLQGGYKFSEADPGPGGEAYEGLEQQKRGIFRVRSHFTIDTDAILRLGVLSVGLVGSGEGWADIAYGEFYHKVEGRARVYLSPTQFFDFVWSSGSGAPLFNNAEQYGVGLVLKL